jgi:hypothetical protein
LQVDSRERGTARVEVRLLAGQDTQCDVVLTTGHSITGTLLDHAGAPLAGWLVTTERPEAEGGGYQLQRTAMDGAFAIPNLEDRAYRVLVFDGQEPFLARTLTLEDVRPGEHRIAVPERARRRGAFVGRVLLPDGRPAAEAEVTLKQGTWHVRSGERADGDGTFTTGPLPPGVFDLTLRQRGFAPVALPRLELLPGEKKQLGDLRLHELARETKR